jgi:hypothetical protein
MSGPQKTADLDRSPVRKYFSFWVQCCANLPSAFRNIGKFSNSAACWFRVASPFRFAHFRRFVTHNMSLHTTLLSILAFILLYGGPFALLAGHPVLKPSWLISDSEICSSMSSSDLRGGHIGESYILLFKQ